MTGPARITIELEPPRGRHGRWATRTRVEEPSTRHEEAAATFVHVPESREPVIVPVGYEPPEDCTCMDGYCEADHANE
ncbi:MAG TPA: hypothetical protein VFP19_09220 [Candidatus Limnocylindrales bacterium]|nr:hypothetical protein [Candidatus Limnocylindrales bacterium]